MPLVEETLFGRQDKVQIAIDRLKAFEPKEGYYLAFSGGKDSQCIYHLATMAGVKFDAHYSVTTVDPPELMRFIRDEYPDVEWERHYWPDDPKYNLPSGKRRQITMWNLIADHTIPPTRQARYCCSALKESGGAGRLVVTGVRWEESARRKALHGIADIQTNSKKLHREAFETNATATKVNKNGGLVFMDDNAETRRMVEHCYAKRKTTVNPIVDWTTDEVWEFLNDIAKVPHCSLYDEGFSRLGCIGCPLQGREGMLRGFERWPRYKELYIKAFDKMIQNHPGEIKVATGELAETNGGVQRYTQDGSLGTPDGVSGQATERTGDNSAPPQQTEPRDQQMAQIRNRDGRSTTYGCGATDRETKRSNPRRTSLSRMDGAVVDESDGGGESELLDKQLLTPKADTHTHTHGASGRSNGGYGCSASRNTETSRIPWGEIPDVLALEVSERTDGWERTPFEEIQPESTGLRRYNPDPKVADYESGAALLSAWVGGMANA